MLNNGGVQKIKNWIAGAALKKYIYRYKENLKKDQDEFIWNCLFNYTYSWM